MAVYKGNQGQQMWERRVQDNYERIHHTGRYALDSPQMQKSEANPSTGGSNFRTLGQGLGAIGGYMDISIEVLDNGGLYCDISSLNFGVPEYSSLGLPIVMDAGYWEHKAQNFTSLARSTAPVDTGFLRAHNAAAADDGGFSCWSLATYSVYQEYGTSRMRAQPWFESSIRAAIAGVQVDLETRANIVNAIDLDYINICTRIESIRSAQQIPAIIANLEVIKERYQAISNNMPQKYRQIYQNTITHITGIITELQAAEEEIQAIEQEMKTEQGGATDIFTLIIQMLIAALISAIVQLILNAIFDRMDGLDRNVGAGIIHNAMLGGSL